MTNSCKANPTFKYGIRVYFEDTDTAGVVFYANYLKFFERARTEWLRQLGVHHSTLIQDHQCLFVVVDTQVSYKKPARLDDWLNIHSTVSQYTATSITFEQAAYRDDILLVQSTIRICAVHAKLLKPIKIPPFLQNLLVNAHD